MIAALILSCVLLFGVSKAQQIDLACGFDMVVVLDISCSITPPNKEIIKSFMIDLTGRLDIGKGDDQIQLGLVTYDKFVYNEFFLNTYASRVSMQKHVEGMDYHPFNEDRPRCGTRTDLALNTAKTLQLTTSKGVRDPLGVKSPPIKKIVLVITDGATFPPKLSPNTKKEAAALKKDTGASVFVVSLPNEKGKSGIDEFKAIASKPTENFLIEKGFEELLGDIEDLFGAFCDPPETDPPSNDTDPCSKFKSFARTCPITMSACPPSLKACCGCPFMFRDPVTKGIKTPLELAYYNENCICEDCIRRSYFCLPKHLRDLLALPKGFKPDKPPRGRG